MSFTLDEITRLAPDDASMKAAKGLASVSKWQSLGSCEGALWGECQGSGSKPYQVQIDTSGPAFRCSCPSRKFPCKHGLALLLLRLEKPKDFAVGEPQWVTEWLASRQQRAERQESKKSQEVDPQAIAKREAKRLARMTAGAEDLRRWLADQVRQGLANLRGGETDWNGLAARMVDAQAPGLAARVKALGDIAATGGDWPVRLLAAMGSLHVLLDGWLRLAELTPAQQADLRTAMGWPADKDDVLQTGERVADLWDVLGVAVEENDKLWERRVWLQGSESGRRALVLDFAHGNRVFEPPFSTGTRRKLGLVFYPSAYPRRALIADITLETSPALTHGAALDAELERIADTLAANPWQTVLPLWVADAVPCYDAGVWYALAGSAGRIALEVADGEAWVLNALVGGKPCSLFGEWDGSRLRPLSAWTDRLIWAAGGPA